MSERPENDEDEEKLKGAAKQERGSETGNEKLQDEGQREEAENKERTSAGSGREPDLGSQRRSA